MNHWITYIGIVLFIILGVESTAQVRVAPKKGKKFKIIGDTTKVYYTKRDNPSKVFLVDSSLYEFEDIEPTWNDSRWYSNMGGILGTPTFDLLYQPKLRGGFRVGLDQYDRYRLHREDIKFYQIRDNRPYTDLYYSQINQLNNYIRAEFAHSFNKNIYLGIQYSLINQQGFYTHQKARNQNVGGVLRYTSNNKKYHGYFHFTTNALKQQNNGGVKANDLAGLGVSFLAIEPVKSSTAQSNYSLTQLSYEHFLYNNRSDSSGVKRVATNEWSHRIIYEFNRYKFFDNTPPNDSSLHGIAAVNPRGIRLFIRHHLLENELGFRQALGGNLKSAPLWVKGYIRYGWNSVYQEPKRSIVHNISVGGIIQNNPQYKFKYRVQGQATWAGQSLDFFVDGRLGYDLGKFGYLEAKAQFQRYQPSLIDRELRVSWQEVWDNNLNFTQIQEFSFGGNYTFSIDKKQFGLYLKGEVLNHTLTNWVYADSLQVHQTPTSINLLQLKAQGDFRIWKIHLENKINWQPIFVGEEYFRVPQFMFKHTLYIQSYIFKRAMLAKAGVAFYYQTPYNANGYTPLTGKYYIQNEFATTVEPRIDAFVSFRIWQFRFFVRGENLLYFLNERNYFTAHRYPIHNFVVRFGISWRLFD